ncbi:MAG: ATP-binding protein [Actinomycetota bacterium]|nr:ATP-binding protein [Actinomycetota bacterium]
MAARRSFSNDKAAVGEARRFVSEVLEDRHPDDLVETAILLTSEVVSNAVLHGRSAPTVAISLAADRVRVEVDDASPALPVRKHYGLEATTGRGLMLLEMLADGWGAERVGSGKRVWFDLDPTAASRTLTAEPTTTAVPHAPVDLDDLDALAAAFGEGGGGAVGGPAARAGTTTTSASTSGRHGPRGGSGDDRTRPRGRGPVRR